MPTDNPCQTDEPFWVIGIYRMEKQTEIWKDLPDYEGYYQISNLGRVKSLVRKRVKKEKILKLNKNKKGYLNVRISKSNIKKTIHIHKMVAIVFLNHVPCGMKLVVDHINNIKTDNRVENLQIITNRENITKDQKRGTSKYVGVYWNKRVKKWMSSIFIKGKNKRLGLFKTEEEAHLYYENALKALNNGKEIIVKKPNFSSKFKGVYWFKPCKKWITSIKINGKQKHLGYFEKEYEAHLRYQEELKKIKNNGK